MKKCKTMISIFPTMDLKEGDFAGWTSWLFPVSALVSRGARPLKMVSLATNGPEFSTAGLALQFWLTQFFSASRQKRWTIPWLSEEPGQLAFFLPRTEPINRGGPLVCLRP